MKMVLACDFDAQHSISMTKPKSMINNRLHNSVISRGGTFKKLNKAAMTALP